MTDTTTQIPQPDVDKALPVPPTKLYSAGQIAAGAFFGSFLAAGFLARANLVALGKEKRGNAVFALSALMTMVILALAIFVPKIPSPVFIAIQLPTVIALAKQEFGNVTDKRSAWGVVGYGMLAMVSIFAVLIALAFVLPEGSIPE